MTPEERVGDADFEQFCELIYRVTGMRFGSTKRYFVDKRLIERTRATGAKSVRSYLRELRLAPRSAEMQVLVESMTVNETYFFREEEQLDRIVGEILPRVCARRRPGDALRLWSMPCSSGEEPYSIAIKLLEDWPQVDEYEVNLFGTDIDSKMVGRARAGLYSERSVHRVPPALVRKYFRREQDRYRVIEELRGSIEFQQVNVLDGPAMRRFRDMDLILCRNMLIYFDDLSRRKVVDAFFQALRPGGALILGASESLGRAASAFDVVRLRGAAVYWRPEES